MNLLSLVDESVRLFLCNDDECCDLIVAGPSMNVEKKDLKSADVKEGGIEWINTKKREE